MTQEQVKQLAELQNIFEERCSEVTNILGKMDKYYNTGFSCSDTFRIDVGTVCCEGMIIGSMVDMNIMLIILMQNCYQ